MARKSLNGQVVVITGGAQGIGLAIAKACVRAGMRVAIGDLDEVTISAAVSQLGSDSAGFVVDVRDRESFTNLLDSAEDAFGPVDVLVNNAGVLRMGSLVDVDPRLERSHDRHRAGGGLFGHQARRAGVDASAARRTTGNRRADHRGDARRDPDGHDTGVQLRVRCAHPRARRGREAIVAALRSGQLEVCVPREIAAQGRLLQALPARVSDLVKHAMRADRVMH